MLPQSLARLVQRVRRDDEEPVGAGKSLFERGRIVEAGGAGFDALGGVVGEFGDVAAGGDDIGRLRLAGGEKRIEYEFAELTCSTGYEQRLGHDLPFTSLSSLGTPLPAHVDTGLFLRVALIP